MKSGPPEGRRARRYRHEQQRRGRTVDNIEPRDLQAGSRYTCRLLACGDGATDVLCRIDQRRDIMKETYIAGTCSSGATVIICRIYQCRHLMKERYVVDACSGGATDVLSRIHQRRHIVKETYDVVPWSRGVTAGL